MMFFYACIGFNNTCAKLGIFSPNEEMQPISSNTRLSYHRCALSKQSLQPPPPPSPFLFFPPKPRSACRFSIWPRSTCEPVRRLGFWEQILGSLSKNDGDGYATSLKKVKSRCFKLYRAYSISFNSSNVGNFFLDLNFKKLYQSSGKEKQRRCLVFTSSKKREIWPFYIVVVQWLQRNVPKSVMHVQSCCFSKLQKPIAFFAILVDVAVVVA